MKDSCTEILNVHWAHQRVADYTAIWQLMAAEKAKIGEMISQWPTIQELRILMKGYAV
jgi:hypothetical protein